MTNPTELPKWRTTGLFIKCYDTVHQTLFGLDKIPSDNHVRTLLDPASPDHFHPVFAEVVAELEGAWRLSASLAATC